MANTNNNNNNNNNNSSDSILTHTLNLNAYAKKQYIRDIGTHNLTIVELKPFNKNNKQYIKIVSQNERNEFWSVDFCLTPDALPHLKQFILDTKLLSTKQIEDFSLVKLLNKSYSQKFQAKAGQNGFYIIEVPNTSLPTVEEESYEPMPQTKETSTPTGY